MSRSGFQKSDLRRDEMQLFGPQARQGYDWWWHSFTGRNAETGEEKAFFIEFFLCNPALAEDEPVLGQDPENRAQGRRPSYLMVKAGAWGEDASQLHRFFSWRKIKVHGTVPFGILADDGRGKPCLLTEKRTRGAVRVTAEDLEKHPGMMCQTGEMSWDLKIEKQIAFNVGYGAGELFRQIQAFQMFWHAEGMKTAYQGWVEWNGARYNVEPETCWGYADKNWGRDFTSPWLWISSSHLTSLKTGKELRNSVFDIGGGCPAAGPLRFPGKLLSAFWYEGTPYEFNFSKFWTGTLTEFDCTETQDRLLWHVEQSTHQARMVTDLSCRKKDMLLVQYEAPDGSKKHNRLWNGGNGAGIVRLYDHGSLLDVVDVKNAGCEYGEYC